MCIAHEIFASEMIRIYIETTAIWFRAGMNYSFKATTQSKKRTTVLNKMTKHKHKHKTTANTNEENSTDIEKPTKQDKKKTPKNVAYTTKRHNQQT